MKTPFRIHVSARACGKADGTPQHPYGTLQAARDAVRKLKRRGGLTRPVRVLVAPGVYRLETPLSFGVEDGGTASCPITWAGDGGRPMISGGRLLEGWKEGTINGRSCWQVVLPDVAAGKWWFTQLFVNGRRRFRARFPKRGYFRFAGVPEEEAKRDPGGFFHGAMSAYFTPGDIRAYRNQEDIDVVVPDHWYENHLRLAGIDEEQHLIRFATKGHSRFSRDETGGFARYRLDHVAEACTEPGDWYLDRGTGLLSYVPMPGEDRESTRVEAPVLPVLLSVRGDALDPRKRVRHLRFEFLDFRHAEWELPRENAGSIQAAFQVPAAVRLVGAEDCALYGCHVSQVAGWGVEFLRGCHRNRMVACAVHDVGGGGVKVGHQGGLPSLWVAADPDHGSFRGMDPVEYGWGPCREEDGGCLAGRDRAEASATTVSDCSIHDGGLIFHSAVAVWVGDAARNRIVHNHIWNFSYTGISCGWTWGYQPAYTYDNRIEGNRIHGIGHGILSDMGAIYTLGRQAGTTIRGNFISDVQSYGYGGWGIYPDEGSGWMRIEDNVVCGTKCGGFHQHYGRDNLVRHNVFAESVENQTALTRLEFVRPVVFRNNLVQGAGNGDFWSGQGSPRAVIDGNVYAGDPGAPMRFAGTDWQAWQAQGHDAGGCCAEAVFLDVSGSMPVALHEDAIRAAGMNPRRIARVVAEAGPRFREKLPPTIDDVPLEPEVRRAIVEPLLWPWAVEWPDSSNRTRPWGQLPQTTEVCVGVKQVFSLTLENRGDALARGAYRFRVVPDTAARLEGPGELRVALKPGEKAAVEAHVVATGKDKCFWVEAVAKGSDLVTTAIQFTVVGEG